MDNIDKTILELLRSMTGVKHVGRVSDDMKRKLIEHEDRYFTIGPIGVDNLGVRQAVERDRTYFIVKDKRFRPPPISTVQLVAEDGSVIGEEIIFGKKPACVKGEKTMQLGKDFIIYCSRAKEKGRNSRFILPPVPFPEIEELKFAIVQFFSLILYPSPALVALIPYPLPFPVIENPAQSIVISLAPILRAVPEHDKFPGKVISDVIMLPHTR